MGDTQAHKADAALVPAGKEPHDWIIQAGQIANEKAREGLLQRYLESCSDQTIRRQQAVIALFEQYLEEARKKVEAARTLPSMRNMYENLAQWTYITFGLVEGFREWMNDHVA